MVITPEIRVARQLAIGWGLHSVRTETINDVHEAVVVSHQVVKSEGFAQGGDVFVMTAGAPFGHAGKTNTLRIVDVR